MSRAARFGVVGAIFAVAFAAIALFFAYLSTYPPTVSATVSAPGTANLTLETVGTIGYGTHPTWVSYLVRNPSGHFVHTTIFRLPAHSLVHVTVYEYDTLGPLRNEEWGKVSGVVGNQEFVNGKAMGLINAASSIAPAHTFAVPALNINVPLVGVSATAKNPCAVAPCSLANAHNVITFSFHTGGPGLFRWQCFVPCGLSFLDGNGGPMSTLGYMGGFLQVAA